MKTIILINLCYAKDIRLSNVYKWGQVNPFYEVQTTKYQILSQQQHQILSTPNFKPS